MLTWSHTRDETFQACRRKYYYRYYAAAGGWKARAPEAVRHAYCLTRLTTFDQALGIAIHSRAREVAAAVLHDGSVPPLSVLEERTRAELNRLYRDSKDIPAFMRDPARHPVLLSTYYGRGVSPETLERTRERMSRCLAHLVESPIWSALAACRPESVWLASTAGTFTLERTTVWAAPDLVYREPGGRPVIVDWKTGRVAPSRVLPQLRIYARFVRDTLDLPVPPDGYLGQAVDLQYGEVWPFTLTAADISEGEVHIRDSIAAMDALLADPEREVPASMDRFPLAARRGRCPECSHWELCEAEIRTAATPESRSAFRDDATASA